MSHKSTSWEEAVLWARNQPELRELVQACFYDDPLVNAARRYAQSSEWSALRNLLPTTKGLGLDVGAGRGIASYALACEGWSVTAVEPDSSDVVGAGAIRSLARETGVHIEIRQTSGEDLPFADNTFDLVHCRAVLHHTRDLAMACREMARVMRPGAMLIATREHVISRTADLELFLASHPLHRLYGGENAYRLDAYVNAIAASGLRVTQILNPLASNINLFPDTVEAIKERIARRIGISSGRAIPDVALRVLGALSRQPGRLYSFVGRKPLHD